MYHGFVLGLLVDIRDNYAVSYTHLDVYKRQGAGCGDIGGYNGAWMRNNSDFFIYISVLYKQLYHQKAQERGRNIQYSWHLSLIHI